MGIASWGCTWNASFDIDYGFDFYVIYWIITEKVYCCAHYLYYIIQILYSTSVKLSELRFLGHLKTGLFPSFFHQSEFLFFGKRFFVSNFQVFIQNIIHAFLRTVSCWTVLLAKPNFFWRNELFLAYQYRKGSLKFRFVKSQCAYCINNSKYTLVITQTITWRIKKKK